MLILERRGINIGIKSMGSLLTDVRASAEKFALKPSTGRDVSLPPSRFWIIHLADYSEL